MSVEKLKPIDLGDKKRFVDLNLNMLLENLENFFSQQDKFFTKPLNKISLTVFTKDGKREQSIIINDISKITQLYDPDTSIIQFFCHYHDEDTFYHDEHIFIMINYIKREFDITVGIVGEKEAIEAINIITENMEFFEIYLPSEHLYLQNCLIRFYQDNPDYDQNVFLIIRFQNQTPFPKIVDIIQAECKKWNLNVVRADEKEYSDDLWQNVLTYMYGCKSAIAVFDQINYREFNPNVALEVGFMYSQCKNVLLLKDQAIPTMPTDIVGKIYKPFNTYEPEYTIPQQLEKWINDYSIGKSE